MKSTSFIKEFVIFLCVSFLLFQTGNAQLTVQGGFTAQQLAEKLAGENITVSNATITGNTVQHGNFSFSGTGFDINSGIIMSTGAISDAIGPNSSGATSSGLGGAGNSLLDSLSGQTTYDAVVLEFDFEVQSDYIQFNYIFASEEYNEWVGSAFNDAFAFFISGPGITGEENLAVVPSTTDPITINNINNNSYWQYYTDNEDGSAANIEFDGYTINMTAEKGGLIPCNTYTLKLMIADGSDGIYDAAVFLKENSLVQRVLSASLNTPTIDSTALEGCINASFTFNLDSASMEDIYVPIEVSGAAVNGVDYAYIDTLFVIPAGQTSASIIIDAIADGLPEGQEDVVVAYQPSPCAPWDTVVLYIDDAQPIEYATLGTDLGCAGDTSGEVSLSVTGGTYPYSITLTDTATGIGNTYTDTIIPDLEAGTYWVEIEDAFGCAGEDIVAGAIYDAGPTFIPDGKGKFYETTLPISGFDGATLQDPSQLQAVCAVLEHSFMGELEISLIAPGGQTIILKEQPGGSTTNLGEPVAKGPVDAVNPDTSAGVGYEYCWTADATFGLITDPAFNDTYTYTTTGGVEQSDKYMPSGSYTPYESFSGLVGTPLDGDWKLKVQDKIPNDNGWIFKWSISLNADQPDSIVTIGEPLVPSISATNTLPDCGVSNGGIDVTLTGGHSPFSFSWSSGQTSEDITGVTAGSYTLSYTDSLSCTYDTTLLLPNNGSLVTSSTKNNVSCVGANDGSIDLTITGGTSPYGINWNTGDTTEDISSLSPGDYVVNISDAAGCIGLESVTINEASPMVVNASVTDETCGDENGIIDLTVSGGAGTYTYLWNTGETTKRIEFLQAGTYSVEIRDANNCLKTDTFEIINLVGSCIPVCDITTSAEVITDETCGNGLGSIELLVSGGTQPYDILWSNGATTEDIFNLSSDSFTITVTDANSCSFEKTYFVNNQTGTLAASGVSSNEICGNGQGAVDLTVSGGAMPYIFNWSTGDATEDISNLSQGSYSVSVMDANNCVVNASFDIQNNTGTMAQTYGSVFDETCGDGSGSIDITITGGTLPYSYSWSNGATSQDLINLSSGTYTCTITDASGCSLSTPDYTVDNLSNGLAVFDIDVVDEVCNNSLGRLNVDIINGTTPYSYAWSNGDTTQVIDTLTAGTYSCTISDATGCSVSTGNIIVQNTAGTLSLDNVIVTDELCGNGLGSIDVQVSGGGTPYTYSWNTGATTQDLNNLSTGFYSNTITDTNGCTVTANANVGNSQGSLSLWNQVVTDETCGDSSGAIDITISGGLSPYNYSWNTGDVSEDLTGLSAGNYTCDISDAQGCSISTSATVNNITGGLSLDNVAVTNEVCGNSGGIIDITISGGTLPYTFNWSNGATTEDISGLTAGTYSCVITDALGCSINVAPITINNSAPGMIISLDSTIDETCGNAGGAIYISMTGGVAPLSYSWSNGATTQDITGLVAGTYTVTVTDSNGCSASKSYDVINNSGSFTISGINITDEVCNDGSGAINITTTGGTGPYTYSWSSGQNTEDISGLSAGTYSLDITDNNGCSVSTGNLTVSNLSGTLSLDNVSVTHEQCSNASGAINLTLSGGLLPYSFNWSNGATTEDISGLTAGIYSCIITDGNGCSINTSSSVQNNSGTLEVIGENISNTSCGQNNGAIDLTVAGGTIPYTFSWNTGDTTEDISGAIAGNYFAVITDSIGCTISHSATIGSEPNDLAISSVGISPDVCLQSNGSVDISVTSSATPLTYSWSSGETTQDITNKVAGSYSVTISDANLCSLTDSFDIPSQDSLCVFTMCNSTGTSLENDTIKDSGGDFNYNNFENCSFLINPDCADSIILSFTQFNLETSFDYLYIYDGTTTADPQLASLTGNFIPADAIATSGSMLLVFQSDFSVTSSGFVASWNTVVKNDSIFADFNISDNNPGLAQNVSFTDLTITDPVYWEWDFGDGNTSTLQNPTHAYMDTGSFNVTLIASNCLYSDTITKSVTVQGPATIVVNPDSINTTLVCESSIASDTIAITNTGVGDLVYSINAPEAISSTSSVQFVTTGENTIHTFTGLEPSSDSLYLTVTINGDYDFSTEYADLYIEGTLIETIVDNDVANGTDITSTYAFGGAQLASWLADGQLVVTVDNSIEVNPGLGGTDMNIVGIQVNGISWLQVDTSVVSGTVSPGNTTYVPVSLNSFNLLSGNYTYDLEVSSNDTANSIVTIPINLTVTGNAQIASVDTCIDFGSMFAGDTIVDTIPVVNVGCGDSLLISGVSFSGTAFSTGTYTSAIGVGDTGYVVIYVHPADTLLYNDNLQIVNNDSTINVCMSVQGLVPPVIEINPDSINATLTCNELDTASFVIKNTGGSNLDYNINAPVPLFSYSGTQFTTTGETTNHTFTGLNPGTDSITITVTINGDYDFSTEYADLYIEGAFIQTIVDNDVPNGTNIVTSYTFGGPTLAAWIADGTLSVQIVNSAQVNPGLGGTDSNIVELTVPSISWMQVESSVITGTVLPGDSVIIPVYLTSVNQNAGTYTYDLEISSNDVNSPHTLPISLTVLADPQIASVDTCIDYGQVFVGDTIIDTIPVVNVGCGDSLLISGVSFSGAAFSTGTYTSAIGVGDTGYVVVYVHPADTLLYNDNLQIANNDSTINICMSVQGLVPPVIEVNPDTINETVTCNSSNSSSFAITNTGGSDLVYTLATSGVAFDSTSSTTYFVSGATTNHTFDVPTNLDSISFDVTIAGDFDGGTEYATLYIDGTYIEIINDFNLLNTDIVTTYNFGGAQLATWAADGQITVTIVNQLSVNPFGSTDYHIVNASFNNNGWLTLGSSGGTTNAGATTNVGYTINTSGMSAGDYTQDIIVSSNDILNPTLTIPVNLTVLANPQITSVDTCIDYGSMYAGDTIVDTIPVYNTGCGDSLLISGVSFSGTAFSTGTYTSAIGVGDTGYVVVYVHPADTLLYNDNLQIVNNDSTINVCMSVQGLVPPVIEINPDSINAILTCNEMDTSSFVIKNTGGSNLDYNINAPVPLLSYSGTQFTTTGETTNHTFTGLNPGTDSITITVTINGDYDFSTEYADLYIEGAFIQTIVDNDVPNGTNIVTSYTFGGPTLAAWIADGTLSVQIVNSAQVNPGLGGTDSNIVELTIPSISWMQVESSVITGTVLPGDSVIVPVYLTSVNQTAGTYTYDLGISSNDVNSPHTLPISLTVLADPQIASVDTCIDYGQVFAGDTIIDTIPVVNVGCGDSLLISGVSFSSAAFSTGTYTNAIGVGDTGYVVVYVHPADTLLYNDNLQIVNNDSTINICMSVQGAVPPIIVVNPDSISATIACGSLDSGTFLISNVGGNDLVYSLTTPGITVDSTSSVTYFTSGATTNHTFEVPTNLDSISFDVTIAGDFDSGTEYATLYIDGTYIEIINDFNLLNTDIVTTYSYSGAQVATWAADGQITVTIVNQSSVNPFGSTDYHIVNASFDNDGWLTLGSSGGTTSAGGSTPITYYINSAGMTLGTYNTTIEVMSNDFSNSLITMPVTLNVTGAPQIFIPDTCVMISSVDMGSTVSDSVTISNVGCDTLVISNITSSNPEFVPTNTSLVIPPFSSGVVPIDFTPATNGTFYTSLTITNNDQDTTLCVGGEGIGSPTITVTPDTIKTTLIGCGSIDSIPITVSNTGLGQLFYDLETGNYSDTTSSTTYFTSGATTLHTFDVPTNLDSITFQVTIAGDYDGGTEYATLYIDGTYIEIINDFNLLNTDIVTTYNFSGAQLAAWAADGQITVSIVNQLSVNPFGTTDQHSVQATFNQVTPYSWLSFASEMDTVAQSATNINYAIFNSSGLSSGTYTGNIMVNSNDTTNSLVLIPVELTVITSPIIAVTDTCIYVDSTEGGSVNSAFFDITNNGCDTLVVSNILSSNSDFSINPTSLSVAPGSTSLVQVDFTPATTGISTSTISIFNNDKDTTVCITGLGYGNSGFNSSVSNLNYSVSSCSTGTSGTFTLSNTGNLALNFNMDSLNWSTWLDVSPASGSILPGGSLTINVDVATSSMLPGVYSDSIILSTNDTSNATVIIPVQLTIQSDVCGDYVSVVPSCSGLVSFTDQSSSSATSWSWNFGDGTTSSAQNPVHQYTTSGTYTVRLIACGPSNCDTVDKVISVNVFIADFNMSDDSTETHQVITFTDASGDNPASWSWDFGDGQTSTNKNPAVSYSEVGTYIVTLTATQSGTGCSDDTSKVVVVEENVGIEDLRDITIKVSPNPYLVKTNIAFELPVGAHVSLKVYNTLGEHVTTLCDEPLSANSYSYEFSAKDHGSADGVYFLKMTINNNVTQTFKLVEHK